MIGNGMASMQRQWHLERIVVMSIVLYGFGWVYDGFIVSQVVKHLVREQPDVFFKWDHHIPVSKQVMPHGRSQAGKQASSS